jgi:hypothetical protein
VSSPTGTGVEQAKKLGSAVQAGGPVAEAALVTTPVQLSQDVRGHGTIHLAELETLLQGISGLEQSPVAGFLATDLQGAAKN